jgi:hypothetical protein
MYLGKVHKSDRRVRPGGFTIFSPSSNSGLFVRDCAQNLGVARSNPPSQALRAPRVADAWE